MWGHTSAYECLVYVGMHMCASCESQRTVLAMTLRCLLAKQTRPVGQDLSFSRVHTGSESVKEDTLFKA